MNEREIQQHLDKKMNAFFNEPAPFVLQEWFYKKFESAYMAMSQILVPHRMYTVQSIIKKVGANQPDTLTRHEAAFIAKVWLTMPPANIEKDISKFFSKRLFLEEISGKLDADESERSQAIQRERTVLQGSRRQPLIHH